MVVNYEILDASVHEVVTQPIFMLEYFLSNYSMFI